MCLGGSHRLHWLAGSSPLELPGKPIIPGELYISMGLTPGATGGWGGGIGRGGACVKDFASVFPDGRIREVGGKV